MFYATFPAARDAAYNAAMEQSIYDLPRPMDGPTLHEVTQPLEYSIRNEPDISSTSASFRDPTQELSYPPLHVTYSEGLHPQQPFISHHQNQQPSYYSPPRPVSFLSFFSYNFFFFWF